MNSAYKPCPTISWRTLLFSVCTGDASVANKKGRVFCKGFNICPKSYTFLAPMKLLIPRRLSDATRKGGAGERPNSQVELYSDRRIFSFPMISCGNMCCTSGSSHIKLTRDKHSSRKLKEALRVVEMEKLPCACFVSA